MKAARGILVQVEGSGLEHVASFRLRLENGDELTFLPAAEFNAGTAHAMSPGHMRQHMAMADPVEVRFRQEGDQLLALSVTDAS